MIRVRGYGMDSPESGRDQVEDLINTVTDLWVP
jgi:hypothetical protein